MHAVNRESVLLYLQIGGDILTRQADQGWGSKVSDRLAQDLRAAFPDIKVFRRIISSTYALLPRRGRILNLCNRCLHNCLGVIKSRCWTNFLGSKRDVGMPFKRSNIIVHATSWFCALKTACPRRNWIWPAIRLKRRKPAFQGRLIVTLGWLTSAVQSTPHSHSSSCDS